MGGNKRNVSMIADMDASSGAFMSKKRKPSVAASASGLGSSELKLCSSVDGYSNTHLCEGLHYMTVSPASSSNSAGSVVSGEIFSSRSIFSCCSSNVVKTSSSVVENTKPPPDLEAKSFEIVESTCSDVKLFSKDKYLLSEYFGDSEEAMTLQVKSPPAVVVSKQLNITVTTKMPPKEEIEEFFTMAEKYEQECFAEKYNYDIAKDMPLDGRYQWVRLN